MSESTKDWRRTRDVIASLATAVEDETAALAVADFDGARACLFRKRRFLALYQAEIAALPATIGVIDTDDFETARAAIADASVRLTRATAQNLAAIEVARAVIERKMEARACRGTRCS